MQNILFASTSADKSREVQHILKDLSVHLLFLQDVFDDVIEFEETGTTFTENAKAKAEYYGEKSKCITLAEDSGLEVDALNGGPGVYSKRYAVGSDQNRIDKLLAELKHILPDQRNARYKTVAALYNPFTKKMVTTSGVCEGYIALNPVGKNGFGYDPIFFVPAFNKTMAQLSTEEKNTISHRGNAARAMIPYIQEIL